jgi:hypothetical protein
MIDNKMPFYNFVNILIAGFVLVGAGAYLFWTDVKDAIESILLVNSIGVEAIASLAVIAIAYEIGYIVFRLGAIAIEPIIRLLDNRRTHDNFAAAQNKYPVLGVLSREYAYARTRIMLFFIIAILSVMKTQWLLLCVCLICVVIMIITLYSHNKKINNLVARFISEAPSDEPTQKPEGELL